MQKQDENALGDKIGIGVDLGSTTIAVSCLNMMTGEEIHSFSFANPQCRYGADVITRIKHCVEQSGMTEKLDGMVWKELLHTIRDLKEVCPITHIVISGNTAMQHILRGLSVDGLAAAPFKPADLGYHEDELVIDWEAYRIAAAPDNLDGDKIKNNSCRVIFPPGFSAYVGADILTGAHYLGLGQHEMYDLLVDLGTNGEMLLVNKKQGLAASTACGPVFDHVLSGARYGSESIHAIAACVKRHLIDRTGKLAEPFFEKGIVIDKNFVIRQENVRNFQLAKGAVFAGIQCLMKEAGISGRDIRKVYISGGLGFYMDVRDAFAVGMFPEDLKEKVCTAGNSSLNGAKELLEAQEYPERKKKLLLDYEVLCEKTESFELSNLPGFQDIYIGALNF